MLYPSTSPAGSTTYGIANGTSYSAPQVTGIIGLWSQIYQSLFVGKNLNAASAKNLLIHTAQEAGNVGPDVWYGWGFVDAKKGAEAAQEESKRVNALSNSTFFIFNNSETIKQMKEGYYNLASSQKDIADALIDISEVQSSLSQAQTDSMEALRVSFEINKSIAQVSQYLFILGCKSIAASQTVCRSL